MSYKDMNDAKTKNSKMEIKNAEEKLETKSYNQQNKCIRKMMQPHEMEVKGKCHKYQKQQAENVANLLIKKTGVFQATREESGGDLQHILLFAHLHLLAIILDFD